MQTASEISVKMERMTRAQQREVIEFLLSRKKHPAKDSIRRERLLNVSVWSDSDIEAINRATTEVNKCGTERDAGKLSNLLM
jgi:CRISPR/Cas system-associated endonuclease Cas3-HD